MSASQSMLPARWMHSSVKSAGPFPCSVSTASATSMALPAVRPSGWFMSVMSAAVRLPAPAPMSTIVCARASASLLGLHKSAGAGLDVQQNRICTGGNLLAHDAGGDQRQAVHRGGNVPQSVNLLVRHRQLPALADQRDADLVDDVKEFLLRQGGAVAGNRFQLIHRSRR